ncbi:PREDICTED: endogenous retrovirus group K member 25 Pol protein-like [Corvus brachyrhynchos]|uniref:endogenous retrovirus group K member 25 Pol protein-like n=1 Tax=Corvus brachyrhynchos TaxID=85066 RepID=UPI00081676CD|nr:PREDICTED: endogenous retrovirus group K member 25 Pol protein-like [Corvus brachyrhynchos]
MENSPTICQWYVSSLLAPVRAAAKEAIILHYMDDVLVCAPDDDMLANVLDLTIGALVAAGFELQQDKIQRMPPWKYLGLEITKRTIVLQKLAIQTNIKTLVDVRKLCGSLNWVRPWLGLSNEDLAPLFDLLKGGEELSSPRTLTPEAQTALEKVQHLMSTRQASRYRPDLPFRFIILGNLPHLHGVVFQWEDNRKSKKDQDRRDPLLIIEWVFLSHNRSKRMTRPQELMAELIRKTRVRIRELSGRDFDCIHVPIRMRTGQTTKAMLESLLQDCEALQFALEGYTGQISLHRPAHKIFNSEIQFELSTKSVRSKEPLKALTVFTDASGASHKSVMTWKNPQTQRWEADIKEVEGSPQVAELDAVVRAFERFPEPLNLVTDSAYVAGVVSRAEYAILQEVSNTALYELLSELVNLVSHREQPYYVMHVRSHTDLPGFMEGNRRADALAVPAMMAPILDVFEQAKISRRQFHQNAPALVRQFNLKHDQARAIVAAWERASDVRRHLVQAFATLGIPKVIKTDNGPAYSSKEFRSFLQQWGIEHKTGIPYSPTGQAIVERAHQNIKRMLQRQRSPEKLDSLVVRLSRALFTLNFLNYAFENPNPPIVRHFGGSRQLQMKEKPPVWIKDPETREIQGPHELIMWGKGYACVSTPESPRWIPSRWVKPCVSRPAGKGSQATPKTGIG